MTAVDERPASDTRLEICKNDEELKKWIRDHLKLQIPDVPVCPHHQAPFDYIHHAYFEPGSDVVVWAPRGGGKTRLGALATLLDLLHKPGSGVRILGGSLEQSLRMWEHLLPDIEKVAKDLLGNEKRINDRIKLTTGSTAAVLTQSQRAVRGLRVQKLRCDEVELFDTDVWEAAQLVTKSIRAEESSPLIAGVVEAISTHHKSHGLMNRIIERARTNGTKIIQWCLLEVLEKCPPERDCDTCPLLEDCGRRAKTDCNGFFRIDDAIAMKRRVSDITWNSEMMCRQPNTEGSVFPSFDSQIHVRVYVPLAKEATMSVALDFGFNAPFVCLWIRDDGELCHVVDEYVQPLRPVSDHVEQMEARRWGKVRRVCCDPAGAARNEQTAESNVQFLKRRDYKVFTKRSLIVDGLEMIRAALRPAAGPATLFIHPKCERLIAAMRQFRYPDGGGELPLKDGTHDHLIDALRYFYVNRGRIESVTRRQY